MPSLTRWLLFFLLPPLQHLQALCGITIMAAPMNFTWDVCTGPNHAPVFHPIPDFCSTHPVLHDHFWWRGMRDFMQPLVERCHVNRITPEVHPTWQQYIDGSLLLPEFAHQSMPGHLYTRCLVPPCTGSSFLDPIADTFRLQPHGTYQHGMSRAYFKVKQGALGFNDKEFYLHDLICYMFNGPSPDPELVAGHMCGNKLCICPWHLYWITQSDNVKMGWDKKKRKWVY